MQISRIILGWNCKLYEYLTYMDWFILILQEHSLKYYSLQNTIQFPVWWHYFSMVYTHTCMHMHTSRERKQKEISEDEEEYMKEWGIHPLQQHPHSHCVRLPSPFSSPLLSLVLWNRTCYRLAAWELRHDVVCTPACTASSHFHIQPRWCARQTSRDIFILQELNDFLEHCR